MGKVSILNKFSFLDTREHNQIRLIKKYPEEYGGAIFNFNDCSIMEMIPLRGVFYLISIPESYTA
jgi:hypothetical protein